MIFLNKFNKRKICNILFILLILMLQSEGSDYTFDVE